MSASLRIYFKSLLANFLTVFFANYTFPGIYVESMTKLPHLGSDFPFSLILALLNSSVYLVLKHIDKHLSAVKISFVVLILNSICYALVKFLPIKIHIKTIEGYLLTCLVVSTVSVVTNLWQLRHSTVAHKRHPSHSNENHENMAP